MRNVLALKTARSPPLVGEPDPTLGPIISLPNRTSVSAPVAAASWTAVDVFLRLYTLLSSPLVHYCRAPAIFPNRHPYFTHHMIDTSILGPYN